jgi:histidinol phosphatase-like PHP family hydrolase
VKVIFWVEGDVINEEGDACLEHQKMKWTFTILSLHRAYESEPATATKWLLKSIERHHKEIHIIGHPYDKSQLWEYIDIKQIVEIANDYHIAMEFNRGTFSKWNTISENLMYMLENAKQIYVNSDAHSLSSLGKLRKECFAFLEERWIT